ncbi:pyridoxamine 5'-phosphate oxidase family protein [Microbacterium sp. P05]|uniref:pyridoxamine 5'-phosphate oxidase family protein n=1 Tax=Microbacterium sp. P05 TaxID=3366948 RepID=UPI0037457518
MTASTTELKKLNELLKKFRFAMLTTHTTDDKLTAVPLTVQETEFDGDLWFIIGKNALTVQHIAANPSVGVSFSSNDSWLSLAGNALVVEDLAKLKELWNPAVGAWFPEGPEDPNVTLLKVDAISGEYWDSPGGRVATLVSLVKSKVTGDAFEADNEKFDL